MNIAMPEHTEEHPGSFEIVGVNNSLIDLNVDTGFMRDAVPAAGDDMVQNP